jgi:sirohydrochlorin cobaltochelatase
MSNSQIILLVAFGTTKPVAAKAFERFETVVRERFPDNELHWTYTSLMVREKLAQRGEEIKSVEESLALLARKGYTRIAVQSLHTIAGAEYHKMLRAVSRFRNTHGAKQITITIGKPLLSGYADADRCAAAMIDLASVQRVPGEALVFMGHGSERHASDLAYVALASLLRKRDPLALPGTVEGHPTFEDVKKECSMMKCNLVRLIPFMAIAGDHAMNDMAGEERDSWKSQLEKARYLCKVSMTGTLDNPGVRDIWLDHLADALSHSNQGI